MKSWLQALARTRDRVVGGLARLIPGLAKADPAALEEWERTLIQADVPPRLVGEWVDRLRRHGPGDLRPVIEKMLLDAVAANPAFGFRRGSAPMVVLITGINGSGKTTTTAKLAQLARAQGFKPLLAAADTFRAAGSHQLKLWADRLGVESVVGAHGGDAAAVAFDAVQAGVARKCDVVFIDTAGRMHTRQPLMEELQKVRRSIAKVLPDAPHESWIVLDATLGNNAVVQARTFKQSIELTGAVIAKLDGSSKGGFVFAVHRDLGLPIRYVGLGEGADDLVPFDARAFVKGFVGEE